MPAKVTYPFHPRSTAYLKPGQFWSIPLADDVFACGRVAATAAQAPRLGRTTSVFLAGLADWFGTEPPTSAAIADTTLLAVGSAHINTINDTGGGLILGTEPLLAADEVQACVFPNRWSKAPQGWGRTYIRALAQRELERRITP